MSNRIIVSKNAKEYFKRIGITSKEWIGYCVKEFDLNVGDTVFFEGNICGYIKNKKSK